MRIDVSHGCPLGRNPYVNICLSTHNIAICPVTTNCSVLQHRRVYAQLYNHFLDRTRWTQAYALTSTVDTAHQVYAHLGARLGEITSHVGTPGHGIERGEHSTLIDHHNAYAPGPLHLLVYDPSGTVGRLLLLLYHLGVCVCRGWCCLLMSLK